MGYPATDTIVVLHHAAVHTASTGQRLLGTLVIVLWPFIYWTLDPHLKRTGKGFAYPYLVGATVGSVIIVWIVWFVLTHLFHMDLT